MSFATSWGYLIQLRILDGIQIENGVSAAPFFYLALLTNLSPFTSNLFSVIYTAHALGVVGFASLLGQLTVPGLFGGSWFWK